MPDALFQGSVRIGVRVSIFFLLSLVFTVELPKFQGTRRYHSSFWIFNGFQFWYRFDHPCANSKSEFSMTCEGFATLPTDLS